MLCLTEEHMHLGGSIQAWIREVLVVEVNADETIIHIQHIGFQQKQRLYRFWLMERNFAPLEAKIQCTHTCAHTLLLLSKQV